MSVASARSASDTWAPHGSDRHLIRLAHVLAKRLTRCRKRRIDRDQALSDAMLAVVLAARQWRPGCPASLSTIAWRRTIDLAKKTSRLDRLDRVHKRIARQRLRERRKDWTAKVDARMDVEHLLSLLTPRGARSLRLAMAHDFRLGQAAEQTTLTQHGFLWRVTSQIRELQAHLDLPTDQPLQIGLLCGCKQRIDFRPQEKDETCRKA